MASLRGRLPCIHTPVAMDTSIVIYRMKYRAKISVLKDAVQSKDSAPQCCSTEQRFHYAMLQYKARIPLLKAALQSKDSTLTVVLQENIPLLNAAQNKDFALQCCSTEQRFCNSCCSTEQRFRSSKMQYRAKIQLLKDAVQSKDSAPQGCSTEQRFRSSSMQYIAKIPLLKDAVQSKDSAPQGCSTYYIESIPLIKDTVQQDFRPLFFSSFEPAWSTDQWVKMFSNFVSFLPR